MMSFTTPCSKKLPTPESVPDPTPTYSKAHRLGWVIRVRDDGLGGRQLDGETGDSDFERRWAGTLHFWCSTA